MRKVGNIMEIEEMSSSKYIASWLVLGPIFNKAHQGSHYPHDYHPEAGDIIMDIDNNPLLKPQELTRSLDKAPKGGTTVIYGTDKIFNVRSYTWRSLNFSGVDWGNARDVDDNIHQKLGADQISSDPHDPQSFAGKHHSLVFFLVHIQSPSSRTATLSVESDDSIRLWLNGSEIESLRFVGDRDVTNATKETSAEINLQEGSNILLVAVAETHGAWAFLARIADADGLVISTELSKCSSRGKFLDGCHINLPPDDVIEEIEFERFFLLNHTFGNIQDMDRIIPNSPNLMAYANDDGANAKPNKIDEFRTFDVALYFPYTQQWKLEGYTRGRLIKSFSLGPGEEQTVELFTWDRLRSSFESSTSFDSEQTAENTGSRRDTLDVARETTRQLGFETTGSGKVAFQVGIFNVDLNQSMSARTAVNDAEKSTRNSIVEATSKSSNKVRTSRALKVTESRESGSEERVTRKLRNPNTCHTLNVPFFEVLANYQVTTFLRTEDVCLVVLIKSEFLLKLPEIDREAVRVYETVLRLALLDPELEPGFAAARLLAARDRACSILCKGCECQTPAPMESVEWSDMVASVKDMADCINTLRSRQTIFPFSIPPAELGISDGTDDIKRHLFNKSLAKNAPRLLIDLAGIGFIKGTEPSEVQLMTLHKVLAALSDDALVKLKFDQDTSSQVWADIRRFIFGTLPTGDLISAGINWGIASVRADNVKGNTEGLAVYKDDGLVSMLLTFNRAYDAWFKKQQDAQQANADLAKEAKIAKEEREIRILESFGLREMADALERLEALLAHINKHQDHYRFAIWNQLSGASDSNLMDLARDGIVDPKPVGVVGDRLAVPLRLYTGTKLKTYFDESIGDLMKQIHRDERRHILPTPALYSEAIVGECDACEEYVEKTRNLDMRQRAALAAQAEQEAERYAARLKAMPALLDNPNPSAESVRVRLETATEKT